MALHGGVLGERHSGGCATLSDAVRIPSPFPGECARRAVLAEDVGLSGHIHPLFLPSPHQQPDTSISRLFGWSAAPGWLLNKPIWHEDWIPCLWSH